jgi:hypothetical protein
LLLTVTALAFAAGFTVAQTTHGTGRGPQFENADVKVWKSSASGQFETFDESVGLPHTGHSESLARGTSHRNR